METTDIGPLLEDFESNVDELEDILQPLVQSSIADNITRLPLLDKAKTYVLITYAIESILFCEFLAMAMLQMQFNNSLTRYKHFCV